MSHNKRILLGRLFLLSALCLMIGYYYLQLPKSHRPHSVEQYWQDSGINEGHLLAFLDDSKCVTSEKYFLACANIISAIGNQIGYSVDPFKGVSKTEGISVFMGEKELLGSWQKVINQRKSIIFSHFWNELKDKIPAKKMAQVLGVGINSFFSIMKDPHTYIIPERYYREIISKIEARSFHSGIWLNKIRSAVFIRRVIPNSPAALAGVEKGARLLFIDGVDLNKLSLPQAIEALRGYPGTEAELVVKVKGDTKKIRFMRQEFKVPSLTSRFVEAIKPFGAITINKFAHGVCSKLRTEINDLVKKDTRGIILDLRDNPGGQIEEAACVAGLFLGRHKIFELRYLQADHPVEEFYGQGNAIYSGPIAVLVNSGTASAAEILAGAIQDYQRGLLIGGKTFGKGSFQEGDYWKQNGKLVLFETKGLFYLPSGRSPQLTGLYPDVELPQAENIESEQKIYFNPLNSKVDRNGSLSSRHRQIKNCLDNGEVIDKNDEELNKAHRYLFCNSVTANTPGWN